MKVEFDELKGMFELRLKAETMEEAAALVVYGINRTKIIIEAEVWIGKYSETNCCLRLGKRKKQDNEIRPAANIGEQP
jgi:hypothetical protein